MRLDAHQHFWSYDAAQYPWIPPGSPLHRSWLPDDLAVLQKPLGFDGSIAVQARQVIEESDWLLSLADQYETVKGVVGWVDLRSDRVEADLERLAKHAKFVGVRHVVQEEPDDAFMLGQDFQRGISKLHAHGLTYDILIFPKQLEAAIRLAENFPAQPFVLDHIAKPPIKAGALEPWATQLRRLAQLTNVHCKVSGMLTEADHQAWKPEQFRPHLDIVFEAFGPSRLMYGSDWPVCLFAGSYEQAFRLVDDYTRGLTDAERAGLFGTNAAAFYLKR
ncbi:MAG: amidohydrolase family protein [Verrucomicrobia bacterium]|nr:amidohydrolase family protein [Verrucomicrobiota bacterium]